MGSKKVLHCKCGHNNKAHKNSFLSFSSGCNDCQCSSFLNRDQPSKLSYIYLALSLGLAAFLIVTVLALIIETNPALNEAEQKVIKFTYEEMFQTFKLFGMIMIIFVVSYMIIGPVTNLFYIKRRRKYPLSD